MNPLPHAEPCLLYQIDPARNKQRFYAIRLERNLFGAWTVIRHWGRIGTHGQQRTDWHETEEAAARAIQRKLREKQRRGYR